MKLENIFFPPCHDYFFFPWHHLVPTYKSTWCGTVRKCRANFFSGFKFFLGAQDSILYPAYWIMVELWYILYWIIWRIVFRWNASLSLLVWFALLQYSQAIFVQHRTHSLCSHPMWQFKIVWVRLWNNDGCSVCLLLVVFLCSNYVCQLLRVTRMETEAIEMPT